MSENRSFPVDPMIVFYAGVTAVENGKVGEVEMDFRIDVQDQYYDVTVSIVIRRDPKPMIITAFSDKDDG